MKAISLKYITIAVFSIVILSTVQFFLIYNTYTIKSEHFFSDERDMINNDYSKAIVNDKLYPGGSNIIDSVFNKNIDILEVDYNKNPSKFRVDSKAMMTSIFSHLKKHNNLKSILDSIIKIKHHFSKGYKYALAINKFEVAFQRNSYITIYPYNNLHQCEIIGGDLQNPTTYNRVTALTISSPTDKSYRIEFSLHIENNNRAIVILEKMLPTFLLSISSIISIIILFFITFNNWIKQKKLAEMQKDFINSISHEFNTPLTAIIIANKSLQNETFLTQTTKSRTLTDIIERQTKRLNDLFGQVLNLTKSNPANSHKQKQNIGEILNTIIEDYKTKILSKYQEIKFINNLKVEKNIPIDIFWFTTMIQNIIDNGIKYNNQEFKVINIKLEYTLEKKIQISIQDNGIGMTEKTKKRIFEKFYRHNNKLTSAGGLGLGLFYVKQCILMHNWDVNIESIPSEGSTFVITI
ncbi:sensor histidine kinase [Rhizosphaericola mali]|uniref:histidine kinase n=1 Tax=Rhizosphaericola mali TaxID=2545455 RepID=A0A5P2FW78_9BACT|nr:HAMP domain-containing sensor histidine kinase [Rhizosphaericola mali]QES87137.1 HAMP domain-containing histidine kinase [Rhizosphaericola mali]